MKIIITGVTGFIGSEIYKHLKLNNEYEVIGVTRSNAEGMVRVDCYSDSPCGDVLIHCAEINNRNIVQQEGESYERQVYSTLSEITKNNYKRYVYLSSAILYGDKSSVRCSENSDLYAVDRYTRIKKNCEEIILDAGGSVARLANVYGPGMSSQNVVTKIVSQIPGACDLEIYNKHPVRDFLWVSDAASALSLLAVNDYQGVFNIGTGKGTSIEEMARLALKIAGEETRSVVSRVVDSEFSSIVLNVSKILRRAHWEPLIDVESGLTKLIGTKKNFYEQKKNSNLYG